MTKRLLLLAVVLSSGCGFEPAPAVQRVLVRSTTSWKAVQTPGDTILGQGVMVLTVGKARPWCVEVSRMDPADSSTVFLRLYTQAANEIAGPTTEIDTDESRTAGVPATVCMP